MALTMTRTRTQTGLTRLANLLANLNGELEFIERRACKGPEYAATLAARKQQLAAHREAVCRTLTQFDPELDPTAIGTADEWLKPYGRPGSAATIGRYLRSLQYPVGTYLGSFFAFHHIQCLFLIFEEN